MGQVVTRSLASPVMPMSIGSPVEIAESPAELSVEISVGSVKDLMKKFEPAETCESVDTLGIVSSDGDLLCDIGKLTAWIEGDSPFPPSAPRDRVKRSKA